MKNLLKNISFLSSLQIVTYVVPLIILPFLIRKLGVEQFGLVTFAQSLCMYFLILTDFGFNLSANKSISINRDNLVKLREIYSSVMTIKIILIAMSLIILTIILFGFERFKLNHELFYISFLTVIGITLSPFWLFQGLEQMGGLVISSIISKILTMIMILLLIKTPSDYLMVPYIYGFSAILTMIFLHIYAFKIFRVKYKRIAIKTVFETLKDSSQYFLSRIANEGLMNSIVFLIGLKFGDKALGYYSMAERLYRAFYMMMSPINQSLYPYMVKNKDVNIFKKVYFYAASFCCIITVVCMFSAPYIFQILFNQSPDISVLIFRILCIATLFGVSNSLIGFPLLGAFGYVKQANLSLIIGSAVSLLYLMLIYYFDCSIMLFPLTILIYELISVGNRFWYIKKFELLKYENN